jgi:ATP-dependent helicase/nuclease subunit A
MSIKFPCLKVIKASAGTGKTYILSKEIAKYLLNDVPYSELRNILAITFTVNAAKEMKERVIKWLKGLAIEDNDAFKNLDISDSDKENVSKKASKIIDDILSNYKDFQVKTIDSFLVSIFKACAIDFGYPEDFEVVFNNREYLKKAFDAYIDSIEKHDHIFFELVDLINENETVIRFDIYDRIFKRIRDLYVKEKHYSKGFANKPLNDKWIGVLKNLEKIFNEIYDLISKKGISIRQNCSLLGLYEDFKKGDFDSFFKKGLKNSPVLKNMQYKPEGIKLGDLWETLKAYIEKAVLIYMERYYYPYISVLKDFEEEVESIKRREEVIFIEDIPSLILKNIENINVPDVYIRLGGRLYHYFIDEFQDTSPIQWANLKVLIDNALSTGGSLFVVGDTKQAIYGFRDADYKIMKGLTEINEFPSVPENHFILEGLETNHRSGENILALVKKFFENAKGKYGEYCDSGIFDWEVKVKDDFVGRGYAKSVIVEDNSESPEKAVLKEILADIFSRGYSYSDVAILAHKNSRVVDISTWLDEFKYPFLSYSSLDIRERKIVQELISILKFLDSPKDNISFSLFILGEIFEKLSNRTFEDFLFNNKQNDYLYKAFQNHFHDLWTMYFENPFKYAGYLPVYELLCYIIDSFKVKENFKQESGAIARLLEVVKELESKGKNSLKEFIEFIEERGDEYENSDIFQLPVPKNINAISIMTVHKAKGLGFPIVIYIMDALSKDSGGLKIIRTSDGIKVVKLNAYIMEKLSNAKVVNGYHKLCEDVLKREQIEDLNLVYVGLTRAQSELYVIGVKKANIRGGSFPIDVLDEWEIGSKNNKQKTCDSEDEKPDFINIMLSKKFRLPNNNSEKIGFEEKRRGELIHLILSQVCLEALDDETLKNIIYDSIKHYPEFHLEEVLNSLKMFLSNQEIRNFFDESKGKVYVEKEFVDREGNLLRLDRLIVKDDKVIVVDYKTGERVQSYEEQMKRYGDVIREIYNLPVECYILYFDKVEVEKVYEC